MSETSPEYTPAPDAQPTEPIGLRARALSDAEMDEINQLIREGEAHPPKPGRPVPQADASILDAQPTERAAAALSGDLKARANHLEAVRRWLKDHENSSDPPASLDQDDAYAQLWWLLCEVDRLRAALAQAEAERDAVRVRLESWQDHLARVHHVACDWGLERLALPEDMSEEEQP